jgi:hypothetical protein
MTDGPDRDPHDEHRLEFDVYRRQLQQSLERRAFDQNGTVSRVVRRGRRQTEVRDVLAFLFEHLAESLALFFSRSYRRELTRQQGAARGAPSKPSLGNADDEQT